jgi:ABC-2 type transport system ATP-binding protein
VAEPRLRLTNVSKHFRLPHEKHSSLKAVVLNWHKRSYEQLEVLKNINLEVKDGEFFGIIGRNGSGKSTLLKILAGIYQPSSGGVIVNGKLTPFIELGVGFNGELTGRDNVFLNGTILGLTRNQIEEKYKEIVAFAELEKFMDQKLKNYSSGMQVRLAFSVAIQAHSDILLIDEVLAVGDLNFQQKCYDYFHGLKKQSKTVVLVTHDMGVVQDFCDRGIVLNNGRIVAEGNPGKIMPKYQQLNINPISDKKKAGLGQVSKQFAGEAKIDFLNVLDKTGKTKSTFQPKDKIIISVNFTALKKLKDVFVGIAVTNAEGKTVFASDTQEKKGSLQLNAQDAYKVTFELPNIYTDDTYLVSTAVDSARKKTSYARLDFGARFKTSGWKFRHSLTHPQHVVNVEKVIE